MAASSTGSDVIDYLKRHFLTFDLHATVHSFADDIPTTFIVRPFFLILVEPLLKSLTTICLRARHLVKAKNWTNVSLVSCLVEVVGLVVTAGTNMK